MASLAEDAAVEAHKEEGNALFKTGKYGSAVVSYTAALALFDAPAAAASVAVSVPAPRNAALRATLLSNRAACHLRVASWSSAVEDCTSSLALAVTPKAMYRRCEALEKLGRIDEALRDVTRLVRLEPKNKAATSAARRLHELASRQREDQGVDRLLRLLREEDQGVVCPAVSPAASSSSSSPSSSSSTPDGTMSNLCMAVAGVAARSETDAKSLVQKGVLPLLWGRLGEDVAAIHPLLCLAQRPGLLKAVIGGGDLGRVAALTSHAENRIAVAAFSLLRHGATCLGDAETRSLLSESSQQAAASAIVQALRGEQHEDVKVAALSALMVASASPECAMAVVAMSVLDALLPLVDAKSSSLRNCAVLAVGRVLAGVPEATAKSELSRVLRPALKAPDVHRNIEGVSLLRAVAMANGGAALWALQDGKLLDVVCEFVRVAPSRAQAVCVDVFAHVASNEEGRALLNGEEVVRTLRCLLQSDTPEVRSAATVTLSKLRAVETKNGFDPDNAESLVLQHAVFDVIVKEGGRAQRAAAAKAKQAKAGGAVPEASPPNCAVVACAVESLSFMLTSTRMKEVVVEQPDVMRALVALAEESDYALAYGIASVFRELTMSKHFHVEEKLKEMEVDAKQWEEFQKLTKQKGETPEGEDDTDVQIVDRVRCFIDLGGSSAIVALCTPPPVVGAGAGAAQDDSGARPGAARLNTQVALAQTLFNLSVHPCVRGKLAQEGGISSCLLLVHGPESDASTSSGASTNASTETKGEGSSGGAPAAKDVATSSSSASMHGRGPAAKVVKTAAHALAKILVTTNTTLLPDAKVMDSLGPLIELTRSNDQLANFEALMAITNITSMGVLFKERAAQLGGIRAFEFCQFSDNMMVRRAATEAMSNMIPCQALLDHLKAKPDRVKMWLAFVEDWDNGEEEGAFETARAAAGGLAMLSNDAEIAQVLVDHDGAAMMLALLQTENEELQHRAAACLLGLSATDKCARMLRGEGSQQSVAGAIIVQLRDRTSNPTIRGLLDGLVELTTSL